MMISRTGKSLALLGALGFLWAQTPDATFMGTRRRHCAFQNVIKPAFPVIPGLRGAWAAHSPIDAFILQDLRAKQLEPSLPLDRPSLIRRVTYDLTGLPPTPAEVDAFLRAKSAGAYETVVD